MSNIRYDTVNNFKVSNNCNQCFQFKLYQHKKANKITFTGFLKSKSINNYYLIS